MWFDETNIMMKWKSQWTRMFLLAVGICPYGQLEEQDEERCSADISLFFFFREPPLTGKEAVRCGSSTSGVYMAIVWICLAQHMAYIQLCAIRWKWCLGRFHWRPCEVGLLVQAMTSFNEVRIHNPFACRVLVHIINIKPSSTPLSLISPGLDVHAVSGPRPHHPCFHLPLPGWMLLLPLHPITSFPACCLYTLSLAWRVLMWNQLCGVAAG